MMRSDFFRKNRLDKKSLADFIESIAENKKEYPKTLNLREENLSVATLDHIMDNAGDTADGLVTL